jgi:hypothetical protein
MKMFFSTVLLIFISVACATRTYRVADQNLSLGDIKRAVTSVIGEPRVLSENQRTYLSQYFSRNPDPKFDPMKSPERMYAKIAILGDRRPYNIDIQVLVEERDGNSYFPAGEDLDQAKKIGKDLRQKLNQGREGRNVIDDFRAF